MKSISRIVLKTDCCWVGKKLIEMVKKGREALGMGNRSINI